jgi:outer membrane protein W
MMRRLVVVSLAAATLLLAGPASAQSAPAGNRGAVQLGLRVGYGVPFGKGGRRATDTTDNHLSDTVKGQVPIGIDAGYLFTRRVYVGVMFQYGFGILSDVARDLCKSFDNDCSVDDTVLGIDAQFHLQPEAGFDPWIGLGAGYEWLGSSTRTGGEMASVRATGIQYVQLQLGGDIAIRRAPGLAVGPFVSLAAGQYLHVSEDLPMGMSSQEITDKSFHEWLLFGLRVVYNFRR